MSAPGSGILERLSAALADRYHVERELGQGGMSTVFLAEDLRHHRQVAIKVLREDLAASMGAARFLREIQIAAGLQHPNILPLLDSGDAEGLLYYVMPYVKGHSLRERLEREGELPVPEAVRLIAEVVDALALAHEQGVIHRDIKPDNVMISGRHALVTDFGVAKAVAESRPAEGSSTREDAPGITTLGVALGTPAYMSPEQAAADPHVDQRADIYAVGAMAYELLTGRPPFEGATPQQVLAAQVTQQPEPLSKRRESVPPALEAVVMRCLEKRPADRWQSAGELLTQLEPLATPSGGLTPTQLTPVTGAAPGRRRLTSGLMWGFIGVVAVAVGVGGLTLWGHRGGSTASPVAWARVQITSTGDANAPLVSPDGKQIVYASRTCADDGTCDAQLVLFDLPTGARQVLADSLDDVQPLAWSGEGAWLLISGGSHRRGIAEGSYVLSHLGGPMVRVGGFGTFVPHGDTALASSRLVSGRDTVYVRRFVPPWSQPIDSFAVPPPADPWVFGIASMAVSPSGRWLAIAWGQVTATGRLFVYDRDGHVVDSVNAPLPTFTGDFGPSLAWSASGTAVLVGGSTASGEAGLRRIAVDPSTGHVGTEDTVPLGTSTSVPMFGRSADGAVLAYTATQRGQQVLWTLAASRQGSFPRPLRRARAASAGLRAYISPDGATVVYSTRTASESGTTLQFFAEAFDGGASHAVTPPLRDVRTPVITSDSRSLVVATPTPSGLTRLVSYDLASGRRTALADVADSVLGMVRAGPDGVAIVPGRGDSILVFDGQGRVTQRFTVPDSLGSMALPFPSPDGRDFAVLVLPRDLAAAFGDDQNMHAPIGRVSPTGVFTPMANVRFYQAQQSFWITGGTLWWIGNDMSDRRQGVYRIPPGGEQERDELLPFPDGCQCSLSADGTRGTAVVDKPITDVWVIRNFDGGDRRR